MTDHRGGRIPANFRAANIAEGLAIQMIRPFAAVAPVPREEDYGVDIVGTLLYKKGQSLIADDSFCVQVKTHTSANFEIAGDGIHWLRGMRLPYFPVVANLATATVSLYTINGHRLALHSLVQRIVFTVDGDGFDDFPLGAPLMTWTLEEAGHPEFARWAYSVLKPAVEIETWNQQYARARSVIHLRGDSYTFGSRNADGLADCPPVAGEVLHLAPGNGPFIKKSMESILEPFAYWISNSPRHIKQGAELLKIREAFRALDVDPDPKGKWDEIVEDMNFYAKEMHQENK